MIDLDRVEQLTPQYKNLLEKGLSTKERSLIVRLVQHLEKESLHFTTKEMRDKVRILQHSYFSALLIRLRRKGVIIRLDRGSYVFKDVDLVNHIKIGCLKMEINN